VNVVNHVKDSNECGLIDCGGRVRSVHVRSFAAPGALRDAVGNMTLFSTAAVGTLITNICTQTYITSRMGHDAQEKVNNPSSV
jgi:hypothetical protein